MYSRLRSILKPPHVVLFKGEDDSWRYRIVAANGEKLTVSESYANRSNAVRAAEALAKHAGWKITEVKA